MRPKTIKWDKEIEELERFFKSITLPKDWQMNSWTRITDVGNMVQSHLEAVKSQNGNPTYLPYLNRLKDLKSQLENK